MRFDDIKPGKAYLIFRGSRSVPALATSATGTARWGRKTVRAVVFEPIPGLYEFQARPFASADVMSYIGTVEDAIKHHLERAEKERAAEAEAARNSATWAAIVEAHPALAEHTGKTWGEPKGHARLGTCTVNLAALAAILDIETPEGTDR